MVTKLALVRNGAFRTTTYEAVTRLVVKLVGQKRWYVELRKIGGWHVTDLEKRLRVW